MPAYTVNPQIRNRNSFILLMSVKKFSAIFEIACDLKTIKFLTFLLKKSRLQRIPMIKDKRTGTPRARTHIRAMRCVALLRAPRAARRNCMFYICSRVQRPGPLK